MVRYVLRCHKGSAGIIMGFESWEEMEKKKEELSRQGWTCSIISTPLTPFTPTTEAPAPAKTPRELLEWLYLRLANSAELRVAPIEDLLERGEKVSPTGKAFAEGVAREIADLARALATKCEELDYRDLAEKFRELSNKLEEFIRKY